MFMPKALQDPAVVETLLQPPPSLWDRLVANEWKLPRGTMYGKHFMMTRRVAYTRLGLVSGGTVASTLYLLHRFILPLLPSPVALVELSSCVLGIVLLIWVWAMTLRIGLYDLDRWSRPMFRALGRRMGPAFIFGFFCFPIGALLCAVLFPA